MNESATVKPLIADAALDRLYRTARSFNDFTAQPVTDAELRALYDLAKWGPTTANSQPQRVVFVRSAEAKEKLAPALSSQNKKKALNAPVVTRKRRRESLGGARGESLGRAVSLPRSSLAGAAAS